MSDTRTNIEARTRILSTASATMLYLPKYQVWHEKYDLNHTLALAVDLSIIETNPKVDAYINEAFDALLEFLGLEDEGFQYLDEMCEV